MFEAIAVKLLLAALGALGVHFLGERKWSKVREVARDIAADPRRTNDPRQAIKDAMAEVHEARVAKEIAKVRDAFVVNGSNPVPKVKE